MIRAARAGLFLLLLGPALGLAAADPAAAHDVRLGSTRIVVETDAVVVDTGINGVDVSRVAGENLMNTAVGTVDPGLFAPHEARLLGLVRAQATVARTGGAPCAETAAEATVDSDGGVLVTRRFACGARDGRLEYRSRIMPTIVAGGREVVRLADAGTGRDLGLFDDRLDRVAITVAEPPGPLAVGAEYLVLGVEHIFLGYDHIAFILAILLWARRIRPLIGVVTAFTVAHSITLALAALGTVAIPSAIVEPAIAATIVYAALENLWNRDVGRRWIGTFLLGLVHGFGFAGVLSDLGLPAESVAVALAGFNVGVEAGQIAIVLIAVPLLRLADRIVAVRRPAGVAAPPERRAAVVHPISVVIAALGLWWLLERTLLA